MTAFAYAIPSGFYYKQGRNLRNHSGTHIYADSRSISFVNSEGTVIAKWAIQGESYDSEEEVTYVSLKSEYGASNSAYWWVEDGKTYLKINYTIYVLD